MSPSAKRAAVADLGQDPRPGPRTYPGQGREQLTERVGQEGLLDLGGEGVAAGEDPVELDRQLGDHPADGGLGRHGHGLGVEGGHDRVDDLGGQARRAGLDGPGDPGPSRRPQGGQGRVLGQQVPDAGLVQAGARAPVPGPGETLVRASRHRLVSRV